MTQAEKNMDEDIAIRLRGIKTAFGSHVIHDKLDLDVRKGEIIGIVGGSGTGKTVLLRTIIGLKKAETGTILLNGRDPNAFSAEESRLSRQDWGVLFQDGALFSSLTVGQNVQVPIKEFYDFPQELLDDISCSKIRLAGLPMESAKQFPSDLSGGMRKRASLARALALDPAILFLDEPTSGLDPITASRFDDLIIDLRDALGLTVFLVTHDLDTLYKICDRVAVLGDKRILINAPLAEVEKFDHPWTQDYFNGERGRNAFNVSKLNMKI